MSSSHTSKNALRRSVILTKERSEPPSSRNEPEGNEEEDFSEILVDSIREGLRYFGGNDVMNGILYVLEIDYGLTMPKIVQNISLLKENLERMFGDSSSVIEDRICIQLATRLGIDHSGRSLVELAAFAYQFLFHNDRP